MMEVPLTGLRANGRVALIDDEDFELIAGRSWCLWERERPGIRPHGPYATSSARVAGGKKVMILMHKLITGWQMTDHVNGNGLDNRRGNLRPATRSQNASNRRPDIGSSSRYLGVTWHRQLGKWQAGIEHQGKFRYLGVFDTEEQAALVRDAAARELHGEYARLNFPERTP